MLRNFGCSGKAEQLNNFTSEKTDIETENVVAEPPSRVSENRRSEVIKPPEIRDLQHTGAQKSELVYFYTLLSQSCEIGEPAA